MRRVVPTPGYIGGKLDGPGTPALDRKNVGPLPRIRGLDGLR